MAAMLGWLIQVVPQVEMFYEGLDTRDLDLMDAKVANGYQVRVILCMRHC